MSNLTLLTKKCRSPDGQCLILSSRDGYCTMVVFDEILTPHHTQQHTLQLQSIANHNSVPLTYSNTPAATPASTPSIPTLTLPPASTSIPSVPKKRRTAESPPPVTPAPGVDESAKASSSKASKVEDAAATGPPKKKRRAALTKVSGLG
jgi:chromatin assembly factor 1 subunit B